MAIIQRPTKQGGATTFQGKIAQGYTKILASEADADIDTIFAAWNGGADTVNIRDNAITSAKLAPGAVGARELADGSIGLGEINQTSLAAWVPSGLGISPADATRNLVIPGSTLSPQADLLVGGARTVKGRLNSNAPSAALDAVRLTLNRNNAGAAGVADDNTLPTWEICLRTADDFRVLRSAAGVPATQTTPLYVQGSDGKTYCTLADASVVKAMLAAGATWRQNTVVAIPLGFNSNNVVSTWITIVNCPSMTTAGGPVLVTAGGAVDYQGASGGQMYLGLYRDATLLASVKHTVSAATGGILTIPLRTLAQVDFAPAGAHVYSLRVQVLGTGANAVTATDNAGTFQATEFC
jgi:hypothetical protein